MSMQWIFENPLWDRKIDIKGKRVFRLAIFWALIFSALIMFWNKKVYPKYEIRWNKTESLPGWIYLIDKQKSFKKGDIVAFHVPVNRFYKDSIFLKQVLGSPGDEVRFNKREVFINKQYVARAKQFSKHGYLLSTGTEGTIPDGFYYLGTSMEDGYDSRYKDLGWINSLLIIGPARRIL